MDRKALAQLSHLLEQRSSEKDFPISGVAVDSRLVKPSNLFFALKGAQVDGHMFIGDAAAKGAAGAVVSHEYAGNHYGLPLYHVDDPLAALQMLAADKLKAGKMKIVAVTGSLGKTTTKEFIRTFLKQKYKLAASPGNSNSQIGLPLAILNHVNGDEEVLVLEMGMTHAGDITKLLQIAAPDIAVITTVELVHACNFASLTDIARAKAEILHHPQTSLGIIPRDIADYSTVYDTGRCPKKSFSTTNAKADFYLQEVDGQLEVKYHQEKELLPALSVPGKHNLHNLLAAIATARSMDVSWEEIRQAMPQLALPERRLQHIMKDGMLFINDAYNASPVSMKAALASLPAPQTGGKRIAMLGDMLELGVHSEKSHHEVGVEAFKHVDSMICVGPNCRPIVDAWKAAKRPVAWFSKLEDAMPELKKQMQRGDVILLKASRSVGLNRVMELLGDGG